MTVEIAQAVTIEIAKLVVKPGEVLVVRATGARLCAEEAFRIRDACRQILPPGVEVMVIDSALELSVIAA